MTKAKSDTQGAAGDTAATAQQGAQANIAGTTERAPGTDQAGNVTTESGRNVGTWPDNGQPQKAGEPGEKSPETDSDTPEKSDDVKNETPVNPQKAGEPGEVTGASASTAEDAAAAGGGGGLSDEEIDDELHRDFRDLHGNTGASADRRASGDPRTGDASSGLTTTQRKLARVVGQLGLLAKLRDKLQAEADEEVEANKGKQSKTAIEAYRETVKVQRENRAEARERFAAARRAAGGVTMHTDKAPVDDRRKAGHG